MSLDRLPSFKSRVAVVGDVMLDRYWHGDSDRLSPEAPVPVVKVTGREDRAGGAANVALNIRSLGAPCELLGIVGEDEAGAKLESLLRKQGIIPQFVHQRTHPTITKLRVLSRNQQLLRLDFEDPLSDLPCDLLLENYKKAISGCEVVIASDYGKGTLSHIQDLIKAANAQGKKILIDPKGTDFERYRGAFMLTPNMKEFEAVAGKCLDEGDLERRAAALIELCDLGCLLITRSEDGMSLFIPGEKPIHLKSRAREVYDVTGAGDTVIGTLAAALACGEDLVDACEIANRAAGIVVGKIGTSAVTPEELMEDLRGADASLSPGIVKTSFITKCANCKAWANGLS